MTPTHTTPQKRAGVTLIELLVVMAIITGLGLLALMLLPSISNNDAALKATETVRANTKIAQALAAGSQQPRGLRFLTGSVPGQPRVATEIQLLEAPPVTVFSPTTLSATTNTAAAGNAVVSGAPRVDIVYDLYTGAPADRTIDPVVMAVAPNTVPPAGTIKLRHVYLRNLSADQRAQVTTGSMLSLPTLGAWSRIKADIGQRSNDPAAGTTPFADTDEVHLDVYPDAAMGAATVYRTYHAGVYGPPVPLLGQATIQLHNNIGVDLEVSVPAIQDLPSGTPYYDLMFSPDGQTVSIGRQPNNAGVFLWVRDITKATGSTGPTGNPKSMLKTEFGSTVAWLDGFRRGGEHHAVGISNGFVGVAPIQWPDSGGNFPQGPAKENVFAFARKKVN